MTRGEDYVLLLRETSKLTLFVSINMGAKIYSFCAKHEIFNPVNPLDFIEFLNIRETQMPIKVRSMKKAKVCYMIYRLSEYLLVPTLKEQWISAILSTFGIDRTYYDTHRMSLDHGRHYSLNKESSWTEVEKFVEGLEDALKQGSRSIL